MIYNTQNSAKWVKSAKQRQMWRNSNINSFTGEKAPKAPKMYYNTQNRRKCILSDNWRKLCGYSIQNSELRHNLKML